jgi:nucleoid-associated protein YgaU/DNA-binding SARP family transcriptional activator
MNPRRSIAVLRGLGSLGVTAMLLVGVPLGLATLVGWPLPTTIPDGGSLSLAINTGITDEFIVNALAVIAWLAWTQLALAFLAEAVAAFRGRQPRDLPIAPGLQAAAARLVAGIIMLAAPLQPARAVAAPITPTPAVATAESAAPVIDLRVGGAHSAPTWPAVNAVRASVGAATRTVAVERHDTYWAIAERELNDGLRWREIQALNVGRTMTDGHVLTAGDEALRSGWALDLPVEEASPTPMAESSEVVVTRGDNLWELSEDRLAADLEREPTDPEVVPYWTEVIDANRDRLADPNNPSLINPGQVLVLPSTGHEPTPPPPPPPPAEHGEPQSEAEAAPSTSIPPTTVTTAPESTTTVAPTTSVPVTSTVDTETQPAPAEVADEDASHAGDRGSGLGWLLAFGGLSSAALAVGAKRLIQRRRREFLLDHDGAELPPPEPDQRLLHQTVVGMADEELVGELQYALGELSVDFADSGVACRPRLVRHSSDSLEVLLGQPAAVIPDGWRSDGDGLVLTLDHPINLDFDLDGPVCPAPLMVTIGQPDEDAYLYVDLEGEGVVSLVGDVEAARRLARSILTELALTPLGDNNRVITIGDLVDPDAAGLPQLTHKETWHDFADDLTSWVNASHHALTVNSWPNAFVGRGHEPDHEALMPMVVIASKPPPLEMLALLVDNRPSAVAIVVADAFEGALTTIRCDAEETYLDDLDVSFTPQQVDATALEDMGRLFKISDPGPDDDPGPAEDQASDDDHREGLDLDEPSIDAVVDTGAEPNPEAVKEEGLESESVAGEVSETVVPPGPPEYEILVRLLGDIRVEGATKAMHAKATSVTAYLALNRTMTSERLEEACWFGAPGTSHRKRLLETMTVCRDAMGSQHLPPNERGTYTIGDGVRTDVDLFDWHVAQVPRQEPAEAIESYRAALDLITGRPFSYSNKGRASFGWVDFEHQATTWEARIAGVALAFTEMCLDHDQPDVAVTTLRRLLQAAPLIGGVVAALMRVHIETGDRSAADHLYQEHVAALDQADLGDPDDTVQQLRLNLEGC